MERILQIIKKSVSVLLSVAIFFCVSSIFLGCKDNNTYDGELLRLHIRANSNDKADQAVKLKVRDAINAYITDNIDKSTFDEAYREIGERLDTISAIADRTLRAYGYSYGARAKLSYEYFPSRMYHDVTVPEGMYDALIVELGSGKGDNWWCVIYPPLCYGEDFKYKSIFAEIFG
ncbi:MAG: stage II sporulation protein R [Clostridiales bacterium]|nr:stage II sporulation protein R [Clostridiales bacterium]